MTQFTRQIDKDYVCMTLALNNASLEWWVVINSELAILDA